MFSELFKPTTTNTLYSDGKTENVELFEDFFQTMLKIQREMSDAIKTNFSHSLRQKNTRDIRKLECQQQTNVRNSNYRFQTKIRQNTITGHSKNKWLKLTFDANTKQLSNFLEEPNECAKQTFVPPA